MSGIEQFALASGLAWGAGLRLYAVLFAAGLLGRLGVVELPASLQVLQHDWVLIASGLMMVIEFFADKIALVDSIWDAVHAFIRIPAGAILAAGALGPQNPTLLAAAAILGGVLTTGTFAAKAGGRAVLNASPEPFSNIAASFGEEALVVGGLYALFVHPLWFLALLAGFVALLIWLLPRCWRVLAALWRRLAGRPAGG